MLAVESGLQHALNGFVASSDNVGIKISTSKTEVFHLWRNLVQCSQQGGGVSLKLIVKEKYYLGCTRVMEDKMKNWMFDQAKQVAVMQALYRSVLIKRTIVNGKTLDV